MGNQQMTSSKPQQAISTTVMFYALVALGVLGLCGWTAISVLALNAAYAWPVGIPVFAAGAALWIVRPAPWRIWAAVIGWALASQAAIDAFGWAGTAAALLAGAALSHRLLRVAKAEDAAA